MTIESPPSTPVAVPPDDDEPVERKSTIATIIEWVVVVLGAFAVAMVIKTFVMQAFFIPSASMNPTLLVNDRVLVNKLSYRLHDVNRGDVIVFEKNQEAVTPDATKDLIKRVIGLPGEQIAFDERGKVFINGQPLEEPYLPANTVTTQGSYTCTVQAPCTVPKDNVWVMGDNRSNSSDSRYIGPVPEENIVGRAFTRVWPLDRLGGL